MKNTVKTLMSNATDTNYLTIFLQIADVVLVIFK